MATEEEPGTDPKKNEDETDESSATAAEETETSSSEDASPARRSGKSKKKARERERIAAEAARRPSITPPRALAFAIIALAAGAAAGWFGHIAQAKAKLRAANAAPAPSGSAAASGPCASWEKQICAGSGATSAACEQAKGATGLLTPATCEVALEAVPATLAKVKADRAPCESLVSKLCKDLPPGSPACTMVTERTPVFPPAKCKELLANYASVLQEVQMIDQQGGLPQQGGPPGGRPPGMPPGMPQGMPPGHPPH